MTRSRLASLFALAFLVLFCFASVTATTTVKETTAVIQMGMPKLLFSLSSASILLIPLAVCAMIAAIIALIQNERNVGFLFSAIAFVAFGLFMIFFYNEKQNASLYNALSEALKEMGVKFKKRDVGTIDVTYDAMTYLMITCAALSSLLSLIHI